MQVRYHVTVGAQRTTVSLDKMLSDCLSLHMGKAPGTVEAHAAVREWMQTAIRANPQRRRHLSRWLQRLAVARIMAPDLRETYETFYGSADTVTPL